MSKKVLAPLAQGFEEIEFINIVDLLRRVGLEVCVAALNTEFSVRGAHGIYITAERFIEELDAREFDGIALAGGYEGMCNLKQNAKVLELVRELNAQNKLVAAICASPIVLDAAGVLRGDFTCYPGCESELAGHFMPKSVVASGNIITGAGVAVASDFALELVRYLCGDEATKKLADEILMPLRGK